MNCECSGCCHWQTKDRIRTVTARCALGKIPWPEFWQVCAAFVLVEEPTVAQQSACRPVDTADPLFFMGVQVVQP